MFAFARRPGHFGGRTRVRGLISAWRRLLADIVLTFGLAFVSTAAVTYYAIGNSLTRYASQLVGSIAGTFVPAASTYEAAGDAAGLTREGPRPT